MKWLQLSVCFSCTLIAALAHKLDPQLPKHSTLVNAVDAIIKKVFSHQAQTVNVVLNDAKDLQDFQFGFLTKFDFAAVRLEIISEVKVIDAYRKRWFNVFIINSSDEFLKVQSGLTRDKFRPSGTYLFILINGEVDDISEVFKSLWEKQIFNVAVVFEVPNGSVVVMTFVPFNDVRCFDTKPITINEFRNGSFIKDPRNILSNNMNNLHKCPMRVAIADNYPPFVVVDKKKKKFSGRAIGLLEALAVSMNFKIEYTYVGPLGFFLNGKGEGPLIALLNMQADISITNWWHKFSRLNQFTASSPYTTTQTVFLIPPGRDLSAFEKLAFPFTLPSWTLILLVFVIGLAVIFFMRFQSSAVSEFLLGRGNSTPYLNLLIAFIGGTQTDLPRRNFARYMLMMFLLYSMIIRTLYQASYYKLQQSNRHLKEIKSIDEMVDQNFTFLIVQGYEDVLAETPPIRDRYAKLHFS